MILLDVLSVTLLCVMLAYQLVRGFERGLAIKRRSEGGFPGRPEDVAWLVVHLSVAALVVYALAVKVTP